jgi:undecaprenyl-diphosphatase
MSTAWKGNYEPDAESHSSEYIHFTHAFLIGSAQAFAIAPGISRSGTTIAVALILGAKREVAARFSFLLAVPAILGALAFELKDYLGGSGGVSENVNAGAMISGMIVATITGIIALRLLLGIVRRGKLSLFAYYCWALGTVAIMVSVIKG